MKKYGLLGDNIAHSLSPFIHRLYYQKMNIDAEYHLLDAEGQLADAVARIKQGDYDGFNVTMPYKRAIIDYLDDLSKPAERMNSVNTVINSKGRWIGDNTDLLGFKKSLSLNNFDLRGKVVLVLGAGGAARGIIYALSEIGAKMVLIYSRTRAKTNALMIDVKKHFMFERVMSIYDTHGIVVDCVINSTPLGGSRYADQLAIDLSQMKTTKFIDLNYSPYQTITIKDAQKRRIKWLGGLDMLAAQALYSTVIWHGLRMDDAQFEARVKEARNAVIEQN